MPFPWATIPASASLLRWLREREQAKRKVSFTVHRAFPVDVSSGQPVATGPEHFYVNVTNASHDRDVNVTHIWFDSTPPLYVQDRDLPKRLAYGASWETAVPLSEVPGDPDEALWLARCRLSHSKKVIRSKPNENVPPVGTVPRG